MIGQEIPPGEVVDSDQVKVTSRGEGPEVAVEKDHGDSRPPEPLRQPEIDLLFPVDPLEWREEDAIDASANELLADFVGIVDTEVSMRMAPRVSPPKQAVLVHTGQTGQLAANGVENLGRPQTRDQEPELPLSLAQAHAPLTHKAPRTHPTFHQALILKVAQGARNGRTSHLIPFYKLRFARQPARWAVLSSRNLGQELAGNQTVFGFARHQSCHDNRQGCPYIFLAILVQSVNSQSKDPVYTLKSEDSATLKKPFRLDSTFDDRGEPNMAHAIRNRDVPGPLTDLDEWEDVLDPTASPRSGKSTFRDYRKRVRPGVREFYQLQHRYQSLEFVLGKKRQYSHSTRRTMGIWEAMEFLNTLVDDSDPDTELSQIEHLLQTAEAIRKDGHPRWFILTGLIHDLGKVLCLFGEPQWAVVGDTFPVGCRYSDQIVFPEFFRENPDHAVPEYQTPLGIYLEGCGLDRVHLSWGHDEYLFQVVKGHLPDEALAMIRYHSFYAWHRAGEYRHLMNKHDHAMLEWVQKFNPYDLYSKGHERPDVKALKPYYEDLIVEFFPTQLSW